MWNADQSDDPLATLSLATVVKGRKTRVGDTLWEEGDLKPEEVPEELTGSGAIAVSLRDVRNSIGKEREQWKLASHSELQSLKEAGAIHEVAHVRRGMQVLPMKVVLTRKPVPGITTKKKSHVYVYAAVFRKREANVLVIYSQHGR